MYDICTLPHPDVNVLARHGAVDHTGDDDGGKRDAKGDLGDERARRAERRTSDEWAGVVVDDDGDEHVERHRDALFEEQCLLEVARVLELGLEGEECDMAGWEVSVCCLENRCVELLTIRQNDVQDRSQSFNERHIWTDHKNVS